MGDPIYILAQKRNGMCSVSIQRIFLSATYNQLTATYYIHSVYDVEIQLLALIVRFVSAGLPLPLQHGRSEFYILFSETHISLSYLHDFPLARTCTPSFYYSVHSALSDERKLIHMINSYWIQNIFHKILIQLYFPKLRTLFRDGVDGFFCPKS